MVTGRPSDYDPKYCQMLIDHMADGLSFEAFGGVVDACKSTLYVWLEKHPEFMDAKQIAIAKCRLWWEKEGKTGLWNQGNRSGSFSESKSFNTGVWIFNMKNRFKDDWRDKQDIDINSDLEKEKLKRLSLQELTKLVKENIQEDK